MVNGITEARLGKPDYHKALLQHAKYVDALRDLGLDITELEADDRFPDSVFVEDVAVCTNECAVITRPGARDRRDETTIIQDAIHSHFSNVEVIEDPGTLEGGDVMMVNDTFYIGLTDRTNGSGIKQFSEILNKYGKSSKTVRSDGILHLKTGVSYVENNNLLVLESMADIYLFSSFNKIIIPSEEAYAANCIWINGTVLIPAGFTVTKEKIEASGYDTIELEMTEFEKLDGGLSCLSLRF